MPNFTRYTDVKISNSKSDPQGHLRALAIVPFDFLNPISQCSILQYVFILHRFRHISSYYPKFKKDHVTLNKFLSGVIYHACISTTVYQSALFI